MTNRQISVDDGTYWLTFISRYRGQSNYRFESQQGNWRLSIPDDAPPFWHLSDAPFSAVAAAIIVKREETADFTLWCARNPDLAPKETP